MSAARFSAREVAGRLGLRKSARGWRGTCPVCGYATAFLLMSKQGRPSGWCASCQDRNAIALALARVGGGGDPAPERPGAGPLLCKDAAERTARALAVWNGATTALSTPADTYLTGRGLPCLAASPALRWRPDVTHPDRRGRLSAMLAQVVDAADHHIAVHRTYLRSDGTGKADVTPDKASLGPFWGGAIRLDPIAPELVIGEGIETSASAGRLLGLPAWAAVCAGNLARGLVLPEQVRSVVIAADPDEPGLAAAKAARRRWRAEGREVRIKTVKQVGSDFNDLLQASAAYSIRDAAHD